MMRNRFVLGLVLISVWTSSCVAQDRIGDNPFLIGVNAPWFDGQFDHDLGPNQQHPGYKVWYSKSKISRYLWDIHNIGFNVVRVWLMERAEGLHFNREGIITGLDDQFLENLDDLVARAEGENIKLYLCLTTSWADVRYPSPVRYPRQQIAYLKHAVRPIAQRLKGNHAVFAFDIFNEIESEIQGKPGRHSVSISQAREFLHRNVRVIKQEDPQRLVSSGSGCMDWRPVQNGYYKGLGLDFYDIHIYRDDGYLPNVHELNVDRPVIVGECGQVTGRHDDKLQARNALSFYQSAMKKGYAGCFLWYYDTKGGYHAILRKDGSRRPVTSAIKSLSAN